MLGYLGEFLHSRVEFVRAVFTLKAAFIGHGLKASDDDCFRAFKPQLHS